MEKEGDLINNGIVFLKKLESISGKRKCLFRCHCGKEFSTFLYRVKSGHTKSCSCIIGQNQKIDYIPGQYIGDTCIYLNDVPYEGRHRKANFLCRCGNEFVTSIEQVKANSTQSCGCYGKEQRRKSTTKHGLAHTPEFKVWIKIIGRCETVTDAAYHNYGARGITIAPEWRNDFQAFYDHVGPRPSNKHSLDRIKNNLGYIPGNLRWATDTEQANNKRTNVFITFNDITLTIAQWSLKTGIKPPTISWRLRNGKPIETVLGFDKQK